MRTLNFALLLSLLLPFALTSCDKEQEAATVTLPGQGGNGGGGGGGITPTFDPDTMTIADEPLFAYMNGSSFVGIWDSTSLHTQVSQTTGIPNGEVMFSAGFSNFNGPPDVVNVQFGTMPMAGPTPTEAEMLAFFAPGPRTFAQAPGLSGVNIAVSIDDMDLTTWYQTNLFSQPSSSSFNITDAQSYDDGSGIPKLKVRCTFNCKVFQITGSGNFTLAYGVMVIIVTSQVV